MPEIDMIKEFSADHYQVMDKLAELSNAANALDVERVRGIASDLDKMLGPHFKFEEDDLYPAVKRFIGEKRANELLEAHDVVPKALNQLSRLKELTKEKAEGIVNSLTPFYIHVSDCEGLTVLARRLPKNEMEKLSTKFLGARAKVGPLTQWKL